MNKTFAPKKERKKTQFSEVMKRLRKNKAAMTGLVILVCLVLIAVLAKWIIPYDYTLMDIPNAYSAPSLAHPFGTDNLGRDLLSRVLFGSRYSLAMGAATVIFSIVVGLFLGSIAGYFGGGIDNIIMRICDIVSSIPGMLMSITVIAVLGTGIDKCIIATSIGFIPSYVRILRASIMSIRKTEYLEAATTVNCSTARLITRHLIPNAIAPVIIQATMNVAGAIMTLAMLSFIGLGIQPPDPEWGALLSAGRNYIRDYPHMVIFPGVFIAMTALSLNLLGDGLRDALDPKLKT